MYVCAAAGLRVWSVPSMYMDAWLSKHVQRNNSWRKMRISPLHSHLTLKVSSLLVASGLKGATCLCPGPHLLPRQNSVRSGTISLTLGPQLKPARLAASTPAPCSLSHPHKTPLAHPIAPGICLISPSLFIPTRFYQNGRQVLTIYRHHVKGTPTATRALYPPLPGSIQPCPLHQPYAPSLPVRPPPPSYILPLATATHQEHLPLARLNQAGVRNLQTGSAYLGHMPHHPHLITAAIAAGLTVDWQLN